MRRFLRIIRFLLKANISILAHYRANFYAGIFSTLLWVGLAVVSISVLTYQAPQIGGWNKYELFAVQGIYSIILGFMYFAILDNLKKLSKSIMWGQLDFVLVKPIDSQFMISVGEYKFHHLTRALVGLLLLGYSLNVLNVQLQLTHLLLFFLFTVASVMVVYSLWFMLTTLSIWLVNLFNLYELFIYLTGLTRYPLEVLRHISQYLMYVMLPLVVVTTVPAQVLLNKLDVYLGIWALILAIGLFFISRKFWQYALKYYTSASS